MKIDVQWNTGALYQAEGQIIRAIADMDTGEVRFTDFSRGITGTMQLPKMMQLRLHISAGPEQFKAWVHEKYLRNDYAPSFEWLERQ